MTEATKVESTKAKARFGQLEDRAVREDLVITDHGRRKFVVIAPSRYDALLAVERVGKDALRRLEDEFHALVVGMQSNKHAKAAADLATRPLAGILAGGALRADTPKAAAKGRRSGRARRIAPT